MMANASALHNDVYLPMTPQSIWELQQYFRRFFDANHESRNEADYSTDKTFENLENLLHWPKVWEHVRTIVPELDVRE